MKKYVNVIMVAVILLLSATFAMVVKADDSGSIILTSEKDAAWTGYTYFGYNTPMIEYINNKSAGSFYPILQTKKLFGYKNVATGSTDNFTKNSISTVHLFSHAGKGNYRFQTQWKSGTLNMNYKTYSSEQP